MTVEDLQDICRGLPGTTEDIKWEDHLCFSVGDKMYLISSPDRVPVSVSFKTSESVFEMLIERPGIIPAPYLARYKWVQVDNISLLSREEWEEYCRESWQLVFAKLPAAKRKEIIPSE